MPLRKDVRKVLVIGSGPIVIGQAAEFDYAGTQACRALKEDGLEVVLVNSNPATIMTDNAMADEIYIEPLTLPTLKRIIEKEQPDSILPTLGGQTGLTLAMQLAKEGYLEKVGVKLLGANPETIDKAEDRQMFKDTMESIGQPSIPSKVVTTLEDAKAFAGEIGYPVIVRPAFTLGGAGGGIAADERELLQIAEGGLRLSPITQILVEKGIAGWKEIEFEVMRDAKGNVITICSMENVDPVGVHTGDSMVVAPTLTLADKEFQMLRTAALEIITALGVEGGCNVQFALHPTSFDYAVIEVNPRVSRSSALASKATGYPIAKVATKIAIGYTLDEIPNAVTGKTCACFEPTIDYVAFKMAKWPFDKFVYAERTLGTQMKATGEVMTLADSFEMALMKAVRGAEISQDSLRMARLAAVSDETLLELIATPTDLRIFQLFELLYRGYRSDKLHEITKIDTWFLDKLAGMATFEHRVEENGLTGELYEQGKRYGYPDKVLERLAGGQQSPRRGAYSYKMVDTCAGEFDAATPYFYSVWDQESEAQKLSDKTVIVLGSGPIRIGQGIEFDYSSVHCVWALRRLGYKVVIINNNPETVSTDFDTADRLYFEPLTPEDVKAIIDLEQPVGVVVAYGGQTAIKLTNFLSENNIPILGTPADSIDMAEDRERFDALLEELEIKRPAGDTVMTYEEAKVAADRLGYPVLVRPSYVLGGQNMSIAFGDEDLKEFMEIILAQGIENPVLVDKYLQGIELEVDAICDGENILIPGIMEHVERTGIHSGDSIAVYPAIHIDDKVTRRIIECTKQLALALGTRGLVNIQYILAEGEIFIIEVNPRASRTVPYISKVTGVPMVDLATRAMLGEKLTTMGYGIGLYPSSPYFAVKVPVFSFEKLTDVDTHLGPEMKSTGEVLGVGKTLEEAMYKGLVAAGYKLNKKGGVFVTVRNSDKVEIIEVAKKFDRMGFPLYATHGTAKVLEQAGMRVKQVHKIHESPDDNTETLLENGSLRYVISTSAKGRDPARDSVKIRRLATRLGIPCLTSIDTAAAVADCLHSRYSEQSTELVNLNDMRAEKMQLHFVKMHTCGNDYIYFDCFRQQITAPESLAIALADRHFGVGGDGVVLIEPSTVADARMRLYNLDGSEAKMGGNALRCVAKYLYDTGLAPRNPLLIETVSGLHTLELETKNGMVSGVRVDMGKAELHPAKVPVKLDGETVISRRVEIGGDGYAVTCLSMGNPHCVVFRDDVETMDVEGIGPQFEFSSLFPERVNAEFVRVLAPNILRLRVWERGNGETLACGTGACAAAVAAVENGFCEKDTDIRIILQGGELTVRYTDEAVYLTGSAQKVFEGYVEI